MPFLRASQTHPFLLMFGPNHCLVDRDPKPSESIWLTISTTQLGLAVGEISALMEAFQLGAPINLREIGFQNQFPQFLLVPQLLIPPLHALFNMVRYSSIAQPSIIYLVCPTPEVSQLVERSTRDDISIQSFDSFIGFINQFQSKSCLCVVMCFHRFVGKTADCFSQFLLRESEANMIVCVQQWSVSDIVEMVRRGNMEVLAMDKIAQELTNAISVACEQTQSRRNGRFIDLPRSIQQLLTPQESEIFKLLSSGMTVKQVGAALDLSIRTIHYRKQSIRSKLGIQNRIEESELVRTVLRAPNAGQQLAESRSFAGRWQALLG